MDEDFLRLPASEEDSPRFMPPVEATMLSVWRRVATEGGTPELTLAEAAALLGSSEESVRQQITGGDIRAFRDEQGRILISASVTYTPEESQIFEDDGPGAISRMWYELKQLRHELEESKLHNERLQDELEAAEKALEYTKTEVANLWRVMTSRNGRAPARNGREPGRELGRLLEFAQERSRIQEKISNVRNMARRRKWPWPLTG